METFTSDTTGAGTGGRPPQAGPQARIGGEAFVALLPDIEQIGLSEPQLPLISGALFGFVRQSFRGGLTFVRLRLTILQAGGCLRYFGFICHLRIRQLKYPLLCQTTHKAAAIGTSFK